MPVPSSTTRQPRRHPRIEAALEQVEGERPGRDEEDENPDRPVIEPVIQLVPGRAACVRCRARRAASRTRSARPSREIRCGRQANSIPAPCPAAKPTHARSARRIAARYRACVPSCRRPRRPGLPGPRAGAACGRAGRPDPGDPGGVQAAAGRDPRRDRRAGRRHRAGAGRRRRMGRRDRPGRPRRTRAGDRRHAFPRRLDQQDLRRHRAGATIRRRRTSISTPRCRSSRRPADRQSVQRAPVWC